MSLRAWVLFNGSTGTLQKSSSNVAGVVRNATGSYTLTLSTPMADVQAFVECKAMSSTSSVPVLGSYTSVNTTSSIGVTVLTPTSVAHDAVEVYVAIYG
jgi:hypothetical protein